jgi:hypothetical protein
VIGFTEIFLVAFIILGPGIPAYVVGKRRDVRRPWLAFIPVFGYWIVLLWSTNNSGWFSLVAIVPIASLAFVIWMAFALPSVHKRSGWWTLALIVPGVHLLGLWFYAFTLPKSPVRAVPVAA